MRPAGDHINRFDLVAADLELDDLARVDIALLNQSVTVDDDEELPLRVVPVLSLRNARLADIDGDLAAVEGVDEFGEAPAIVAVHLERIFELLLRKIREIEGVQLLREGTLGRFGEKKGLREGFELLEEIDDLAESDLVRRRNVTISPVFLSDGVDSVEFAALLLPLEKIEHPFDEIVDIEEFKLSTPIVDGKGFVVRDAIAKRGYERVILRSAMPHQIREAIDGDLSSRFLRIVEEELFPGLLAASILAISESPGEGRLDRGREHDRSLVAMLLEKIEQLGSEPEVPLHEILGVLRSIYAREIEDEVRLLAIRVELLGGGAEIILVNFLDAEVGTRTILVVSNILEIVAKGGTDHPLSAGD